MDRLLLELDAQVDGNARMLLKALEEYDLHATRAKRATSEPLRRAHWSMAERAYALADHLRRVRGEV